MDMILIMGWEEYFAGFLLFLIGLMGTYIGHQMIRPYILKKFNVDKDKPSNLRDGMFLHIVPAVLGVSFMLLLVNVMLLSLS